MMHTEEEARKLWCPMVRISTYEAEDSMYAEAAVNRPKSSQSDWFAKMNNLCIASSCMMWRWTYTPDAAARTNLMSNAGAVAKGYCGLGGKP